MYYKKFLNHHLTKWVFAGNLPVFHSKMARHSSPDLKLPIKRLRLKLIRITNIAAYMYIIHRILYIGNGN